MAEASQPEKKSSVRFRETLDTIILGTPSTSIGVLVLIIWNSDIQGFRTVLGVAALAGEMHGVAGLTIGRLRNGTSHPSPRLALPFA
jgi:hypothetical protein